MRNLLYPFFIILVCGVFIASCANEDKEAKDDKELPLLSSRMNLNWGDTIMVNGIAYKINIDTLIDNHIDTLVIGKMIRLSGHFSDDKALYAFRVKLYFDSISQPGKIEGDTTYFYSRAFPIVGARDTTIMNMNIIDLPVYIVKAGNDTLYLREGDYIFDVSVMDMQGKRDSTHQTVKLLRRSTIVPSPI